MQAILANSFLNIPSWQAFLVILSWIGAAVAVVVIFSFTVFIHEFGHYLAARLCGLKVDAFSIGFGPSIWHKRVNGIDYKVGWFPFGGYVALPQLDPTGMQTIQGSGGEVGEAIPPALWWKRIIVSVSGPLGNVLFAIVLAILVWMLPVGVFDKLKVEGAVIGYVDPGSGAETAKMRAGDHILSVNGNSVDSWGGFLTECHLGASGSTVPIAVSNILDGAVATLDVPVEKNDMGYFTVSGLQEAHLCAVASLVPGSPAAKSGLQTNDVVLSINGVGIVSVDHAVDIFHASNGRPQTINYLRNGVNGSVIVVPEKLPEGHGQYIIGVTLSKFVISVPMWMQYRNPVDQIKSDVRSVSRVLSALVAPKHKGETGRVAKALSGPVMIVSLMWMTILSSLSGALAFVRFLNINLAILNLLPLPVLDGGHIVFALWRGLFRREIPAKLVNGLVNVFAVLLIAVFVLITFRDVWSLPRFFGRHHDREGQSQSSPAASGGTNATAVAK